MEELIANLTDWDRVFIHLLKMAIAFILSLPTTINREKATQILVGI